MTMQQSIAFTRAYIKSMRLYYSFITGIAGLLGLSYYQYVANTAGTIGFSNVRRTIEVPTPGAKMILIFIILFMSWGINQIINDALGLKEDRINAPDRPMVTGELDARAAVLVSACVMLGALILTWLQLEPIAVLPLVIGVGLNILYEHAKGYGLWGNVVFGIMISMCGAFGFMAAGPSEQSILTPSRISMLLYIALINGLMTFYTYFKDYEGDKASGKNTIVVRYGLDHSKHLSIIASFLPTIVFIIAYFVCGVFPLPLNGVFILLALLTVCLQIWTGYLYYRNPAGEMTYYSLSFNFRACACAEAALIALFNPALGILLFLLTYILVGFLFNFHANTHG